MVPQGLAHFSERVAMRISCVTYNADMILLDCHMCSSVDMWEKFLSRFRPSCIKCGGPVGDKKAPLLQFSPLLLPTLPKFAHFAHLRLGKLSKSVPHLEDGGDFESKTSIQLNVMLEPFITLNERRTLLSRWNSSGFTCVLLFRREFIWWWWR